jgi:uncharacterized protein (DUF1778 family)
MQQISHEAPRIGRIELRASDYEKAILSRAASLEHLDLTSFIVRTAVPVAQKIIEQAERLALSERDSLKVLDLLENPPRANQRLAEAARLVQQTRTTPQ